MRDIFTDLYKKVIGFFQSQDNKETSTESKTVAVNRMKLVLMQDRTNLTPFLLEKMRGEMIDVLAKYVEMDKEALELNFEQDGEQMALMLSIPVLRAKDEEEIQAALEAETEADETSEESDENVEEVEDVESESEESEETEKSEEAETVEQVEEEVSEEIEEQKPKKTSKKGKKAKEEE